MTSRSLTVSALLLAGTGLILFSGCQPATATPPPPKPPVVVVALPTEDTVADSEDFTGRMVSTAVVEVRSRVSGYLDKVHFKDGEEVTEGDLLFEIDRRPYEAEVARSTAAVVQAKARRDRLARQEERGRTLVQQRSMSVEDYETIKFDKAESEGALASAEAGLKLAELNLSYTRITARISGRISRRMVDPGNLIKADDTLLTTIVSQNPIYAYFDMDERTDLKMRRLIEEGRLRSARESPTPVHFSLADETEFEHTGMIDFIDNQVEMSTGTMRLRAIVQNPKGMFVPGLFVRLRVPVGPPRKALMVKEEALGADQGQRFLYVVNEKNEVVYRRVIIGRLQNGKRVIEEGLKPNERVIVTGLQRVRPGVKVEPRLEGSQASVASESKPVSKDQKPVAANREK